MMMDTGQESSASLAFSISSSSKTPEDELESVSPPTTVDFSSSSGSKCEGSTVLHAPQAMHPPRSISILYFT